MSCRKIKVKVFKNRIRERGGRYEIEVERLIDIDENREWGCRSRGSSNDVIYVVIGVEEE